MGITRHFYKTEKDIPHCIKNPQVLEKYVEPTIIEFIKAANEYLPVTDKWHSGNMSSKHRARFILHIAHSMPKKTIELEDYYRCLRTLFTRRVAAEIILYMHCSTEMHRISPMFYKHYMVGALTRIIRANKLSMEQREAKKNASREKWEKHGKLCGWLKKAKDCISEEFANCVTP